MPYTVAGVLNLNVEFDLRELGPERGEPVVVHWPWTNHLWTLLPLGLLALPFSLRRNRHRGAVVVLVPTLAMYFLWVPLEWFSGGGTGNLDLLLGVCAVGLGVLCLVLPWIATGGWRRTWAQALLVVAGVEFLALLCFTNGSLAVSSLRLPQLLMPVIGSAILITSVVLAAHSCRRGFDARRFLLWQAIWLAVISPVTVIVILTLQGSVTALSNSRDFYEALAATFAFAVICFALGVPFLLLALVSRTYRERFRAAFGSRATGPGAVQGSPGLGVSSHLSGSRGPGTGADS